MQSEYDLGMKWNDRLRAARDAAGKNNTDIAKACKVSNPTVTDWINGKTVNIESRHLLPVCKLLGVSPFYLMLGEEVAGIDVLPRGIKLEAMDTLRLIALFAQSTDDGRAQILDAAEAAEKR